MKISTDYLLLWKDNFESRIVKKDNKYGVLLGEKEILPTTYDICPDFYDNIGDRIYFFKNGNRYDVYSSSKKKLIQQNETITDFTWTLVGLYVKRGDGKWYIFTNNAFSYYGSKEIGYDSLYEFKYPTRGILGYTNGKIHHYQTSGTYKEVTLPNGISNIEYISDTDGFIYKLNGKFGYSSKSITFPAVIENLNIGYDNKAQKSIFSTTVNGKEYFFYAEGFDNNSIKSYEDCKTCKGRGYLYGEETETRFVKGKTTVHSERIFLWKDGEYYKVTTEVIPDHYESTTHTTTDDCGACKGSGKTNLWIRISNTGKLFVP